MVSEQVGLSGQVVESIVSNSRIIMELILTIVTVLDVKQNNVWKE